MIDSQSNHRASFPKTLTQAKNHTARFLTWRVIFALMLREMTSTYGRSPGGYLWAFLEPAVGILVLVLIFSTGFRSPPLGTNFAIYYASGLLPFYLFLTSATKVQQTITYSRQLLSYPRVTIFDALLARLTLNVLLQTVISAAIFTFILTFYETRTVLRFGALFNAFFMAVALGLGVGALNCVLMSREQIWISVWSVITRPLILISGVIFLHEDVSEPYRSWMGWNPLVHIVGEARRAFYFSYNGDYLSYTYIYGIALVTAAFGFLLLRSYGRDFLER